MAKQRSPSYRRMGIKAKRAYALEMARAIELAVCERCGVKTPGDELERHQAERCPGKPPMAEPGDGDRSAKEPR